MEGSEESASLPFGIWEPLPFTIELGLPIPAPTAAVGTPSRLNPSTPETSRLLVGNPFDSPDVAAGSGRAETWPYTVRYVPSPGCTSLTYAKWQFKYTY